MVRMNITVIKKNTIYTYILYYIFVTIIVSVNADKQRVIMCYYLQYLQAVMLSKQVYIII